MVTADDDTAWLELPPQKKLPALRSALDEAMEQTSKKQGRFLRVWATHNFIATQAMAALKDSGQWAPDPKTLYRWKQQPQFQKALDLWRELILEQAGIEATSILMRIDDVINNAMEKDVAGKMRDPQTALSGLKQLGAHVGVRSPEQLNRLPGRLVINFIHDKPPPTVIEAEFTEVSTND